MHILMNHVFVCCLCVAVFVQDGSGISGQNYYNS